MNNLIELIKKIKKIPFWVVCLILTFINYGHTLFGNFVFDDRLILENAELFKNPNNLFKIAILPYQHIGAGLYRPLTLLSYAINYSFFKTGAWSYHLVNLILYAFTGYLLFVLLKKLFNRKDIAYVASLLFLILPIHTEVIANIIGRAEIFALFFSLFVFIELSKKKINFWKAGLWFFIALAGKETALAIIPIAIFILAYKLYKQKLPIKIKILYNQFAPLSIFGVFLSLYLTLRFFVLGENFISNSATLIENPLKFASISERIFTGLKILTIYVQKSIIPIGLCSDYSYNQITIVKNFFNIETIIGSFIMLFLIFSIFFLFKKAPILAFGSSLFLFAYLPISNLISPIGTIAGERLMYYPSIGICIYLSVLFVTLFKSKTKTTIKNIIFILFIALTIFYCAKTFVRSIDWLNEENLFISAAQCAPNSVLSISNLGTVYYFDKNYKKAEEIFLTGKNISNKYSKLSNNLGLVYLKTGKFEEAKKQFYEALAMEHPYPGAIENMALLYLTQNNNEQAQRWLRMFSNNSN